MSKAARQPVDWAALWRSGDLARFCFISLGILLHAGSETMTGAIMAVMVEDIGGVQMVGWSFAIYEVGAILAGAATGRLSMRFGIRTAMVGAALLYAVGCFKSAAAPSMEFLLIGRLVQGLGGGALVSLAFVSTERLFSRDIWPQLFAILSVVWGVAAFGGPLAGAVLEALASWRWAFGFFGILGAAMAIASFAILPSNTDVPSTDNSARFPFLALLCLATSIMLISAAGVEIALLRSSLMMIAGLGGLVLFFWLHPRDNAARLFPAGLFDPRTTLGAGFVMVAALSISTISFAVYGPLILASLHGFSPLLTGYIIASESLAWSALSILVANAKPEREPLIITAGAVMIAAGVAGFAYAVPAGSIPLILVCALLQGGGFGIAWPFVTRTMVEAAKPSERPIAASGVPTLQRLGYAIGAGLAGMIANGFGFSGGYTREAAASAGPVLFLAFVPVAVIGCIAAYRVSLRSQTASG